MKKKQIMSVRNPECPLYCTELIRMGNFQSRYASSWNNSETKSYGSKFVSVLCYGTDRNQDPNDKEKKAVVDLDAFQISNQGACLVKEGVIKPSKEDPIQFRVRKSNEKYIFPELQFMDVNEYGKDVIKRADPFFPALFFIIGLRQGVLRNNPKPKFKKT